MPMMKLSLLVHPGNTFDFRSMDTVHLAFVVALLGMNAKAKLKQHSSSIFHFAFVANAILDNTGQTPKTQIGKWEENSKGTI